MTATLPDIVEEAERLVGAANHEGTTLTLLGGVAVGLNASAIPDSLQREYKDRAAGGGGQVTICFAGADSGETRVS